MYLSELLQYKILNLLTDFQKLDPLLKLPGASSHKYKLGNKIKPNLVRELEDKYNFTLPEDYFWFITELGNGGAGPFHGLFKFGETLDENEMRNLSKSPILTKYLNDFEYKHMMNEYKKALERLPNLKSRVRLFYKLGQGLLNIGTYGNNQDIYLIVSGEYRGRILYYNMKKPPRLAEEESFIAWYENWLESSINKLNNFYNPRY